MTADAPAASASESPRPGQDFLRDAGDIEVEAFGRRFLGHACRFEVAAYRDGLFAHHAIAFAPQLERAVPKRRGEFLAGRLCARRALARVGVESPAVPIGRDREPVWPDGAVASITHAGGRALCLAAAAADTLGLGVDIEQPIGAERAAEIAGVVVDSAEQALIRAGFDDPAAGLIAVFSAKESLYKALFPQVRRFFGFEAMRLARIEPRRLEFVCAEDLAAGIGRGRAFAADYRFDADGGVLSLVWLPRPL
ncbi:4'-phosphopantetheinyl transferase superfamily protein [Lysobacter sp. K5869]|uniref:4'-phosphopantetheinyl transferase family protein n=1 Tax=Lysobacter sp. K5869 TaxID=2820808 RepID=UPI001C060DB2|nr:4'-phosphopantetheinyl transferase superfamily protein [Lysobacter sp. K5869]QWP77606.1 4'-phosphopantetheinyl transferase superfamily protein [Lysobacter sp. K5869]